MDGSLAPELLSALAQPTRLTVFSLLVRRGAEGMIASDIAEAVGVPRNLMSAHLTVLAKAGLVNQTRSGRNITYRASPARAAELAGYIARLAADGG